MRDVEFMEEVEEAIDGGNVTFILFTRRDTEEREQLLRRVDRLLRRNPAVHAFHIDLDRIPTAAGRYTIFHAPGFVIYFRGTMASKVEGAFRPSHVSKSLAAILG